MAKAMSISGMEAIGRNVVAKVVETDAELKAMLGTDGPYIVSVSALSQGTENEKGNVTLATTAGKLGKRLMSGGRAIHLTHRAMFFPQYQEEQQARANVETVNPFA